MQGDNKMKILVVGDSCIDRFIYGSCDRICPEAPVPVFNPTSQKENLGMAGNVKSNLEALEVECSIITNDTDRITKTRYVDSKTNQMLMRVDENDSCNPISVEQLTDIVEYDCDAIIISDYCKGFLNEDAISFICKTSRAKTFLNTKKKITSNLLWADFIQVNQFEYQESKKFLTEYEEDLVKEKLIVTYGEKGCYYKRKLIPQENKVEAMDLSGAGDTFLSAFVVHLLLNSKTKYHIENAISYAQMCASDVVKRRGVVTI